MVPTEGSGRRFAAPTIRARESDLPVPPKPPDRRQRRNKRNDAGIVAVGDGLEMPKPDRSWLKSTVGEWADYWQSDVSGLVNAASDVSGLRRLFTYRDEHARAAASFRKERLSLGSQGQVKLSPMGDLMMKLEKLMLPLEDRYGLSAFARLRLGAELGGAAKSLAEMNDALAAQVAGGEDDDDEIEAIVVELPGLPKAE